LIDSDWDKTRAGILEIIPICTNFTENYKSKPIGDSEIDEIPLTKSSS